MIDEWLLIHETMISKIISNSGLELEELIQLDKEESKKAVLRLQELKIPEPWIKSHPNVSEISRGLACRTYLVINSQGKSFANSVAPIQVHCSIGIKSDNRLWHHVSLSKSKKIPSYQDVCLIKDIFIGPEHQAIQIFPPKEKHVNDHQFCLHLWQCLEGQPIPDFSIFGTI